MKRYMSVFFTFLLTFAISSTAFAFEAVKAEDVMKAVGKHLYETVKEPIVGSVGGEWAVLGLARSELDIPDEYYEGYYQAVEEYVKACEGIIHDKKYTEYSRVIIALTAIGKNPEDVAGYNLLTPLGDYEKTIWQGVNGAIWALVALDSGGYVMPENKQARVQATREMYIDHILAEQTADGGWALSGDTADADITGMALQALSKYQDNYKVRSATEKALSCLSDMQKADGGFASSETENSESSAQIIVALCELGISVQDDRFLKNGRSVPDNLLTFYDNEAFKHTQAEAASQMATEQCFYALVALNRANKGENSLYSMSDADRLAVGSDIAGLADKCEDVRKTNIINPGKSFEDIAGNKDKAAIEALAERGIISGKAEKSFEPYATMTRAELATIIARALGLPQRNCDTFSDVASDDWFYSYVGTAYAYGIIKGVSERVFNPDGTVTREEAAVMVARAVELCGIATQMDISSARDILAQFADYVKASDWSQSSLAFCYNKKILDDSVMDIRPVDAITRAETAAMLYNMLLLAKLL